MSCQAIYHAAILARNIYFIMLIMIKYNVPFFANTKDNTHCVQACFKSILKFFLPERAFSFAELGRMSKKSEGKGTWWFPMYLELKKMRFDIKEISNFDYEKYYKEGKKYLQEIYTNEQTNWYLEKSNLLDVKKYIPEFLVLVKPEVRKATNEDFERLLSEGYLLISDVNYYAIQGKVGYGSHAVVVFGFDEENFYLHDPGLPPRENLKVSKKLFQKAGGDNLSAFKLSAL